MILFYKEAVNEYYSLMSKHGKTIEKIIVVWILQFNIAVDQSKVIIANNPDFEKDLAVTFEKLGEIHESIDQVFKKK